MARSVSTQGYEGRIEARRASARAAMRGNDGRGGLLGRLAGATKGGAVRKGSMGGNEGSSRFQAMQAEYAKKGESFSTEDGNNGVW